MHLITAAAAACILIIPSIVILRRYRRAVAMISDFPGLRLIVSPMCSLGLVLPSLPMPLYTYPGFSFPSVLKHEGLFKRFKCDTVSLCGFLDGRAILYTCDVPFLTRMASHVGSTVFPKPIEEYGVLGYFGDNVVIAEGANWRRQRKVTAPAFSSKVFERLWVDMADITREMIQQENWDRRTEDFVPPPSPQFTPEGEYIPAEGEIYFPNVVDITLRMALAAIARTGFGIDFEWRTGESFTNTCQSFGESFYSTTLRVIYTIAHVTLKLILPTSVHTLLLHSLRRDPKPAQSSANGLVGRLHLLAVNIVHGPAQLPQEKMRLQEALHLVAKESTLKLAMASLPSWISKLPIRRLHRMNMAFECLQQELGRMVTQRRKELMNPAEPLSPAPSIDSSESGDSFYSQSSSKSSPVLSDNSDLLSNLVRSAVQTEKAGGVTLTEEEIVGNAYIYLLAGHETTAHSLAWTLALLAAYPEQQEKAYQEIIEGDPSEDTIIRDYPKFRFLLACYYETLRLFPPVQQIPKIAAEDTQIVIERTNEEGEDAFNTFPEDVVDFPRATKTPTLHVTRASISGHRTRPSLSAIKVGGLPLRADSSFGVPSLPCTPATTPPKEYVRLPGDPSTPTRSEFLGPMPFTQLSKDGQPVNAELPFVATDQTRVVIKKDTIIFISPPAVHYNPKYWKDPHQFNPERFLKPYHKGAFIPFGVGTRACLGRKFSEVESVCMLVHLLRNYSVHLPVRPGETVEDVRAQFSKASVRITLTPDKIPLIFRKRNQD